MMRRLLSFACAIFGVMLVAAPVGASTSGAHFFSSTGASIVQNGPNQGQLIVTVDEAGVGQENVDYSIPWTASATWACLNGGGKHPKAANKETISASGSTSASLQAENGRVQATIPVTGTPPGPGMFSCPGGQRLVLASVSYSVTINDLTNGVSAGPFTPSATFLQL